MIGAQQLEVNVLPHQLAFMQANQRFVCLTGGFGCGKSFGVGLKTWNLARINAGFDGMLVSRSATQLRKLQLEVEEVFRMMGTAWKKKGTDEYHLTFGDKSTIVYTGTTENDSYTRWAGGNLAFVVIDELDTMPKADQVWKFANDRVRVNAPLLQTACASTPEGRGFLWTFFDKEVQEEPAFAKDRCLIEGCTFDNPYININYVRSQIQTRDPRTLKAYVYGKFIDLSGVLVYYRYDPSQNHTTRTLKDFKPESQAHIGLDFNKNINAASISIIEDGIPFTVGELYGSTNVDVLISDLNKTLGKRPFKIYPDASGFEGIQQLERAYGASRVIYPNKNPPVNERVAAVNERLMSPTGAPRAYINPVTCPQLANGLLRQTRDAEGKPDKSRGLDHSLDGYGYFINSLWPVGKNIGIQQGRLTG